MRYRNQYTEAVEDYKIRTGTDPFVEYKTASEEKKEEIAQWLFNVIRKKNEIPRVEISDDEIQRDLITLSEITPDDVYHDNAYWFNLAGNLTIKEFFWDKMNNVTRDGAKSIVEVFNSDHQLMRSVKKSLSHSQNEIVLFHWIQLNGAGYGNSFRPASAKVLYELYGKSRDCKVLDTSAGYGARMVGCHFARNTVKYLATDPNTADECMELADYLDQPQFDTHTDKKVLKMGSEDLSVENFPELKESFDLSFTSPPYFNTEKYSKDATQSWVKFPSYGEWIKGFYRQTIYNTCDMLKVDGVFSLNIFEKVREIKKLTKLFLADKGFYMYHTDRYVLRTRPGVGKVVDDKKVERDRTIGKNFEPIWYAKHYSQLLKEGLITEAQAKQFRERAFADLHRVKL